MFCFNDCGCQGMEFFVGPRGATGITGSTGPFLNTNRDITKLKFECKKACIIAGVHKKY